MSKWGRKIIRQFDIIPSKNVKKILRKQAKHNITQTERWFWLQETREKLQSHKRITQPCTSLGGCWSWSAFTKSQTTFLHARRASSILVQLRTAVEESSIYQDWTQVLISPYVVQNIPNRRKDTLLNLHTSRQQREYLL